MDHAIKLNKRARDLRDARYGNQSLLDVGGGEAEETFDSEGEEVVRMLETHVGFNEVN
jgi:hypothetical protein